MEIIDKIFTEKQIINNNHFTIVHDKFPLCRDHLLALSSIRQESSLCHKPSEVESLMKDVRSYYNEPFYFFERGNASFCTSICGPICSHIHFVPKRYFRSNLISNLANLTEPNIISSFEKISNTKSEYFLFGDDVYMYFKSLTIKPEKRFLRNYFKKQLL